MTVKVSWYDKDKTIILQEFPVTWTWEEFYEAVRQTVEMEKTVNHPLYVMGTNPPNAQHPKGNVLTHYNAALKMHPPHMRYYIIATNDFFTTVMGNIFIKTSTLRKKTRMVTSVDDALNFITKDKEKLSIHPTR